MGLNVFVQSKNMIFQEHKKIPKDSFWKHFGYVSDKDTWQIREKADIFDIAFLKLLKPADHLVLNSKQVLFFEQSLKLLKEKKSFYSPSLEIIQEAIDTIKTDRSLYLKFDAE